jgi:predicted CXXCH cytochrome family protein
MPNRVGSDVIDTLGVTGSSPVAPNCYDRFAERNIHTPNMTTPLSPSRFLRWIFGGLTLALCASVVVVMGKFLTKHVEDSPSGSHVHKIDPGYQDPRLGYIGPYRNVPADVDYVGANVCAGCHETETKKYGQHPMGNSAFVPSDEMDELPIDPAHHNPFDLREIQYLIRHEVYDGVKKVWHEERVLDPGDSRKAIDWIRKEIAAVIGSGVHGRTYLVREQEFLCESPISWYSQKQIWDVSPGYERAMPQFNRPITAQCMFCHVDHAAPVAGVVNRFREETYHAIGCERCHGPGALHVRVRKQEADKGKPIQGLDTSIVNPRDLSPDLREAVCQQCHLQTEVDVVYRGGVQSFDFRPGLPLQLFFENFVGRGSDPQHLKPVGQVQQMYSSKCFIESRKNHPDKGMGCISCHDPHWKPPADKVVEHYRQRCLTCHGDKAEAPACSSPLEERTRQQPDDSCFACHMPRKGTDIIHTSLTDHRVLRTRDSNPPLFIPDDPFKSGMPLVSFHADHIMSSDRDARRTLAIALVAYLTSAAATNLQVSPASLASFAQPVLAEVLDQHPDDVQAALMLARLHVLQKQRDRALEILAAITERQPDNEDAMTDAGLAALDFNNELAVDYFLRALRINPSNVQCRTLLVQAMKANHDWNGIVEQCEILQQYLLRDARTRQLQIEALLKVGHKAEAEKEFAELLKLQPEQTTSLRAWWRQLSR